ncbi:hypothetical protein P0W64_16465 [Tsukamurella sp. 8F]|uniref:hypothetical protein n=1 Tax=unclassified Tsukamurella TaxID=2633480 RepID=UPI0023B9A37F|nr:MULTISPECIES: hypothetical protein [unclassified Tsukamurella]MDF0531129.1 hypothetical protein [Tsukamurella sp. 8J]MDF0588375.1 hypothetical protein [Tsukamurella sp. 8F]
MSSRTPALERGCGADLLRLWRLTTAIASRIREQITLDDGSRPVGIAYPSKKGTGIQNWAVWMRKTDDGTGVDVVAPTSDSIGKHTAPLIEAAELLGINRIF